MKTIDLAAVEVLFREALPRATEEEIAELLAKCSGRIMHPDNDDLLRPLRPRDREDDKVRRAGMLFGYLLTGHRNGWFSSMIAPPNRRLIEGPAKRAV